MLEKLVFVLFDEEKTRGRWDDVHPSYMRRVMEDLGVIPQTGTYS